MKSKTLAAPQQTSIRPSAQLFVTKTRISPLKSFSSWNSQKINYKNNNNNNNHNHTPQRELKSVSFSSYLSKQKPLLSIPPVAYFSSGSTLTSSLTPLFRPSTFQSQMMHTLSFSTPFSTLIKTPNAFATSTRSILRANVLSTDLINSSEPNFLLDQRRFDSILKKRRAKMRKHKYEKRRKDQAKERAKLERRLKYSRQRGGNRH